MNVSTFWAHKYSRFDGVLPDRFRIIFLTAFLKPLEEVCASGKSQVHSSLSRVSSLPTERQLLLSRMQLQLERRVQLRCIYPNLNIFRKAMCSVIWTIFRWPSACRRDLNCFRRWWRNNFQTVIAVAVAEPARSSYIMMMKGNSENKNAILLTGA